MAVHRAHLLLLAMLALCISSSSANAWTHPTGRRSGAARLLGLGEAWEADGELDGSSKAHGIGGWLSAAAPESPSGGGVDAVVGGGAGPSAPRGSAAGLQGGLLPVAAWPQPWPVPGGVQGLQGLQGAQAGPPQEQQLVNTVGGLGVLSDLSSFFSNLQENIESMENMTPEERRLVLGAGDSPQLLPQAGPGRPMSAPALMTSLRHQRPSYRTRHFVETSEPAALRRSNNHDPGLLWTGLGR